LARAIGHCSGFGCSQGIFAALDDFKRSVHMADGRVTKEGHQAMGNAATSWWLLNCVQSRAIVDPRDQAPAREGI
jgi:hypothetical protein